MMREWLIAGLMRRWRRPLRQRRMLAARERRIVSQLYMIDAEDAAVLAQLQQALRARRLALGLKIKEAAELAGRHPEFVSMLERGVSPSPKLSSLQMWAGALDVRIDFQLDGFWDLEHDDSEMLWLDKMREPWGKDAEMRLWLIAALRAWRIANGIDMDVVATGIGMHRNGAFRWEWESTDPLFARAAATARFMGTRLTMPIVLKEQWDAQVDDHGGDASGGEGEEGEGPGERLESDLR